MKNRIIVLILAVITTYTSLYAQTTLLNPVTNTFDNVYLRSDYGPRLVKSTYNVDPNKIKKKDPPAHSDMQIERHVS